MKALFGACSMLAAFWSLGCNFGPKIDAIPRPPVVELYDAPPDEDRYRNPPESKYIKPGKVVDQASKLGGQGAGPSMVPGGQGGPGGSFR